MGPVDVYVELSTSRGIGDSLPGPLGPCDATVPLEAIFV